MYNNYENYPSLTHYNLREEVCLHTEESLIQQLKKMGINPKGTVLVHSSMKSIGTVDGGADTVLDALSKYMKDGLLVLPTHTWSTINNKNPKFYVDQTESVVGILTQLFWKRPNVIRSWHPTHSVAALGKDAQSFIEGDERFETPCARGSALGKLLDREGTIMLVGVDLRRNTFIHGIEEWNDIPGRISDNYERLYTVLPDGTEIPTPSRRHCGLSWSKHYWKVEEVLAKRGSITYGQFGDAKVIICNAVKLNRDISKMLKVDPELFSDNEPLAPEMVERFTKGKLQAK